MTLYCGIDLHSNNHVVCVINDKDERLLEARLDNISDLTIDALSRYKKRLKGVAIESTFNGYWLVDALQDAGFHVVLVNTAKVIQYSGLKRTKKLKKKLKGSNLDFCLLSSRMWSMSRPINGIPNEWAFKSITKRG